MKTIVPIKKVLNEHDDIIKIVYHYEVAKNDTMQ